MNRENGFLGECAQSCAATRSTMNVPAITGGGGTRLLSLLAALGISLAALFCATGCPQAGNTDEQLEDEIDSPDGLDTNSPYKTISFTNGGQGSGTLVSRGATTVTGAKTYYIDPEIGNDSWNGTHPLSPWKSFRKANAKTSRNPFKPGDHILLEADGVWNGDSVTKDNYRTLINTARVGMLYPKGNGEDGKPIVIDLYDRTGNPADGEAVTVYYSANRRPIINGNGTPALDSNGPYWGSGAIQLLGAHWWEIRNIEVTNTFADISNATTRETHWYDLDVRKQLSGIRVFMTDGATYQQDGWPNHVLIENCYVHDVQSALPYGNSNSYFGSSMADSGYSIGDKGSGGINFVGHNVTVRGNIIKRVSLEALRTFGPNYSNQNVIIEDNYLEKSGGDGIVITADIMGLVQRNILKEMCAAPTSKSWNYAGAWAMASRDTIFQYNECYGIVYGWNDAEAWDVDQYCNRVIYQYNYSHHNSGGVCLFMSQDNSVFRYNISANDGGSAKYLATVTEGVNTSSNSYTRWNNGQCYFHYTGNASAGNAQTPLIYNNTFFTGDGITCGVFGNDVDTATNRYVRFYNNVIVKAGTGTVHLAYGQTGNGNSGGVVSNPAGFKNNLLWAYNTDPATEAPEKIQNGNVNVKATNLYTTNNLNNKWQNPGLKIQQAASVTELRNQRDTVFPETDFTTPSALTAFTSKERLRGRAGLFTPVDATTVTGGLEIPSGAAGTRSSLDGAWDSARLDEDLFGVAINHSATQIGAAVGPWPLTP